MFQASSPVTYFDVTRGVPSHSGVFQYYLNQIAPTLGTATPVLPPAVQGTPSIPTGGGGLIFNGGSPLTQAALAQAGTRYEFQQLRADGAQPLPATRTIVQLNHLDEAISLGRFDKVPHILDQFETFVRAQTPKQLPLPVQYQLLNVVSLIRAFLPGATG